MSDLRSGSTNTPLDPRFKIVGVVVILAVLYVLVQHTRFAPMSHVADDFIGGFAVGAAIAALLVWLSTRP